MVVEKAKGTFGVKQDGRSYGGLPVKTLQAAGIDPEGRVDITYIEGKKGHRNRLVFVGVKKRGKLKGQIIVRLKRPARSEVTHFEQQGILFKKRAVEGAELEVHDDQVHMLLPKGTVRKGLPFVKIESEPEPDVRANPLLDVQAAADRAEPKEWTGLPPEANDAAQCVVEAIQRLGLQQRIFDHISGRSGELDPQALWDALLKEIY